MSGVGLPPGYVEMLGGPKAQVREAQLRVYRVVNEHFNRRTILYAGDTRPFAAAWGTAAPISQQIAKDP